MMRPKSIFHLGLIVLSAIATFLLFYRVGQLRENEKINLLLFLMLANGTSLVFYIIHVVKNSSLTLQLKLFWSFGIWGLHIPFSFVYWLLHINRRPLNS